MVNKKLFFLTRQIQIKGFQKELKIQSIIKFTCIIVILLLFNLLLISCGGHCERDTDCPGAKICAGYESLFWDGRVCVYSDKDLVLASDITCIEPENTCKDMDQDGFGGTGDCNREAPQFDCNDRRDDIYPGAEERCDSVDNNCNGLIDALDPYMVPRFCAKQEGVCEGAKSACEEGNFQYCSDNKYSNFSDVYAPFEENNESLCDNLDNDCDGQIDEGFEKSCYSGPENTMGIGLCRAGLRSCDNGILTGCINEQTPEEETCANTGEDNNCDGVLDNIAEMGDVCINEESESCREGIFQCVDSTLSCITGSVDFIENCNGLDDNCDDQVDNASYCNTNLSCGNFHCCLLLDGVARCWGKNDNGQSSPPGHIFKSITAGHDYTCGLLEVGTVDCWGNIEVEPEGEFTQIDAGDYFVCGLKANNTVECWGYNPAEPTFYNNIVAQLVVGLNNLCILTTNGQAECTGSDFGSDERFQQLSMKTNTMLTVNNICGINYEDLLECVVDFPDSNLPDGPFAQVAVGASFACAIKKDDSTIECWGSDAHGVLEAPFGEFIIISAGLHNMCGLRPNGILECWGDDSHGQSSPQL